jgi:hypothetical protein
MRKCNADAGAKKLAGDAQDLHEQLPEGVVASLVQFNRMGQSPLRSNGIRPDRSPICQRRAVSVQAPHGAMPPWTYLSRNPTPPRHPTDAVLTLTLPSQQQPCRQHPHPSARAFSSPCSCRVTKRPCHRDPAAPAPPAGRG